MVKFLRLVNIMASSLSSGMQLYVMIALLPVMRMWPVAKAAELHQELLDERPDRFLRPTGFLCSISSMLILLIKRDLRKASGRFTLLGFLGESAIAIISFRVQFPINREVSKWSLDAVPEKYAGMRTTWYWGHLSRVILGIGSLTCFILAALTDEPEKAG